MQQNRINFLKNEIISFPEDPFNYYALALEYLNQRPEESERLFISVLERFPEYLPIYYQAAWFFYEKGDYNKVDILFRQGIALAEVKDSQKALKELKGAYQQFIDEIG